MRYFKRAADSNNREDYFVWYFKTEEVVHMTKENNNYVNVVSIKYFREDGRQISAPPKDSAVIAAMEWEEISAAEFAAYML